LPLNYYFQKHLFQVVQIVVGKFNSFISTINCLIDWSANLLLFFNSSSLNCNNNPTPTISPCKNLLGVIIWVIALWIACAAAVLHFSPPMPPTNPAVSPQASIVFCQEGLFSNLPLNAFSPSIRSWSLKTLDIWIACWTRPSSIVELVIEDSYHFARASAMPLASVLDGAVWINLWSYTRIFGQDPNVTSFINWPFFV